MTNPEDGVCFLPSQWVIVPRSHLVVNLMIGQQPSMPQVGGWTIGCWRLAAIGSVSKRKGQNNLMGSIYYTRIPFILVVISQSHLSPLSDLYSADPQEDLKTHHSTNVVVLFLCNDSHDPLCLWIHVLCLDLSLSQSCLIVPFFHDHDNSAYCQPHSGSTAYTFSIVIYF